MKTEDQPGITRVSYANDAAQQAGDQPFTIPSLRIFPKTKLTSRSI